MSLSIDFQRAREVLHEALKDKASVPKELEQKLKSVILGSHKTYRYILVTNLLAKAVNPKANALCLQAGAPLCGAFDSRSGPGQTPSLRSRGSAGRPPDVRVAPGPLRAASGNGTTRCRRVCVCSRGP